MFESEAARLGRRPRALERIEHVVIRLITDGMHCHLKAAGERVRDDRVQLRAADEAKAGARRVVGVRLAEPRAT